MKKRFALENLGCANCAARMQDGINKLDGVNSCKITFMTQKMILDVEEGCLDDVLDAAQEIITSYESDCVIVR